MSNTPSDIEEQGTDNLDLTKFTPSSSGVISRQSQATINTEHRNHSRQSTIRTEKRNKSEKNIKETTSTALLAALVDKHKSMIQEIISESEEKDTNAPIKIVLPDGDSWVKIEVDGVDDNFKCEDSARLQMPTVTNDYVNNLYNYVICDEGIKKYILNGETMNIEIGNAYDEQEIHKIVDHIVIFGVHYYLVKWKKWSKGFSTWECFYDLSNALKCIGRYVQKRSHNPNNDRQINVMHLMLPRKLIALFFDKFRTADSIDLPSISPEDMSGLFNSLYIGSEDDRIKRKKALNLYLGTISLNRFLYEQLDALKQWEIGINLISNNDLIKVENNMDLEGPPNSFVYVTKYVPRENVNISYDPPVGCNCQKNCKFSKKCCNELSGSSRVYDTKKCITIAPGYPIYECNKTCKCTNSCYNRVVQLGSTVRISIYKTRTCGWGIKTCQDIVKGQFIAIYSGEIITKEESYKRLREKTSLADLMFNLDFNDPDDFEYIMDASNYSNFARFINHSCDPNLRLYAVWINCLDRNLPELAFFSNRNISTGEQLTFDYFSRHTNTLNTTGIRCQCNMKNCKGYYFNK